MKVQMITTAIVLIVVLLFTLFGFFITQPCDIDAVYLWCRLHPFSLADLIGCILFYGGAAFLSGLPALLSWNCSTRKDPASGTSSPSPAWYSVSF